MLSAPDPRNIGPVSLSRNTDSNHYNCYLTTNYEAEGDDVKAEQVLQLSLSVATLTVFTATDPSLDRSQDIQGDTCDMA